MIIVFNREFRPKNSISISRLFSPILFQFCTGKVITSDTCHYVCVCISLTTYSVYIAINKLTSTKPHCGSTWPTVYCKQFYNCTPRNLCQFGNGMAQNVYGTACTWLVCSLALFRISSHQTRWKSIETTASDVRISRQHQTSGVRFCNTRKCMCCLNVRLFGAFWQKLTAEVVPTHLMFALTIQTIRSDFF